MIINKREFHCVNCNGIKTLDEKEEITICPFCGIDKFGKIHHNKVWKK